VGAGGDGDGHRGERTRGQKAAALCGVIRPTFCLANLSYLTSAALEDKQRRPEKETAAAHAEKPRERERESPAAIFYWKMKWRFIVQKPKYITRASYF
jgi:hypothetical protein